MCLQQGLPFHSTIVLRKRTRILVLFDLRVVVDQTAERIHLYFKITLKKYFMLKDGFDSIQCLCISGLGNSSVAICQLTALS